MTFAAAWIDGDRIYSQHAQQSGRFWIFENWIWGPGGPDGVNTGYWIADGWIWGPEGADDMTTGFYVENGWINGPGWKLPFA
jgi:hypothetical protein